MNASEPAVLTIGHSTHGAGAFLALLRQHQVEAVADVRSSPYSQHTPQFNREAIEQTLREAGVRYVFLGKELGARAEDRSLYLNGRVQYGRLAQTQLFQSGLERVLRGAERYRIALMCAESDPSHCHRFWVADALGEHGADVLHIINEKEVREHPRNLFTYGMGE